MDVADMPKPTAWIIQGFADPMLSLSKITPEEMAAWAEAGEKQGPLFTAKQVETLMVATIDDEYQGQRWDTLEAFRKEYLYER